MWFNKDTKNFLESAHIAELGGPTWYINAGKIAQNLGLSAYKGAESVGFGGVLSNSSQLSQRVGSGSVDSFILDNLIVATVGSSLCRVP